MSTEVIENQEELESGAVETEQHDNDDLPEEVEKASRLGWKPKDEFRGDPEKWTSAKEFLKRGEEQLPLVKAELRRMQQRYESLEKTTKNLAEHHKRTEEMAYKRAVEDLRKQRAEAISELDGHRVNEIDDKLEELRNNKPAADTQSVSEQPAFVNEWLAENAWVQDLEGQAIAEALATKIAKQHPELFGKREILEKVTEEARRKYPQLFPELENPRRAQPAAVASGASAKAKPKKTAADLPQDARDAMRDFVKRGFMTEAEYLKDYFGEQA